jgi:hypothetical protein
LKKRGQSHRVVHYAFLAAFLACWGRAWVISRSGASKDDVNALVGLPVVLLLIYLAVKLVSYLLRTWLQDVQATTLRGERRHETRAQIAVDVGKTDHAVLEGR